MTRRKMIKFRMSEISAVRKPAQEGATIDVTKADDRLIIAKAAKVCATCGAASMDPYCANCGNKIAKLDCDLSCVGCGSEIIKASKFCSKCGMAKAAPVAAQPLKEKIIMSDQEKIEKASLEAQIAKLTKLADLTDAQKSHYNRLSANAQETFLAKSATDRTEELKPVYTADDGTIFTKADDPRMIDIAKRADQDRKTYQTEINKGREAVLKQRAETELKFFKGDENVRTTLLRMVDTISDEKLRGECLEALKAHNDALGKGHVRQGTGGGMANGADPQAKLDQLVEKHAADNDVTVEAAYDAVLMTKDGASLYKQIEDAKRPTSAN